MQPVERPVKPRKDADKLAELERRVQDLERRVAKLEMPEYAKARGRASRLRRE